MPRGAICAGAVALALLAGGGVFVRQHSAQAPMMPPIVVGTVSLPPSVAAMAVDEQTGRAFVLTYGTKSPSINVLDTRTGRLLRAVPLQIERGLAALTMTIDARAGRVIVAASDKSIRILDARTGALLHEATGGTSPEQVVVDTRTGRTFISNALSSSVTVLDTRSGRVLSETHVDGQPYAMAVDERTGRVFVKSDGGGGPVPGPAKLVNMLDGTSGHLLRTVTVGHDHGYIRSGLAGDVVVDTRRGHVFVTTPFNDTISMLDARSGRVLHAVGGAVPESTAVDERSDRVFVLNKGRYGPGAASMSVSVLDARSGRLVRMVRVGQSKGWPVTPLVDEQTGRVFVANSASGTVSVLDARNGRLVQTTRVGTNTVAMAIDRRSGRVFVLNVGPTNSAGLLTGPGSVSVLNARTGHLLHRVSVGWEPGLISVDERADRVLVLNIAGNNHDGLASLRPVLPFLPSPKAPCNGYGQEPLTAHCQEGASSVTVIDATR